MNQESVSRFREALKSDPLLCREFLSARSTDEAAALAARHGWTDSVGDLKTLLEQTKAEIGDAQLQDVSGGRRAATLASSIQKRDSDTQDQIIGKIG